MDRLASREDPTGGGLLEDERGAIRPRQYWPNSAFGAGQAQGTDGTPAVWMMNGIKKPARTRRGLLPGSLAGWLITCCNTRSSQGVLPMFIEFGNR
jgi:hypothetical protein